jgi:hypothetical protein
MAHKTTPDSSSNSPPPKTGTRPSIPKMMSEHSGSSRPQPTQGISSTIPGLVSVPKLLRYRILEHFRHIFLVTFYPRQSEPDVWHRVSALMNKRDSHGRCKSTERYTGEKIDSHRAFPTRPPMDKLCEYTAAADLPPIQYPRGSVIANRAIADTLMAICKTIPEYQRYEIHEIDIRYLRFYIEHALSFRDDIIPTDIERALKKEFEFAYIKGLTTTEIVHKMQALYVKWSDVWELMTAALGDETWLYHVSRND